MAESLARIYGTEEDKINCPFYFKIGACRHGDRCSRQHNRPHFSQTLLIPHMYHLPPIDPSTGQPMADEREHLIDFCDEVIDELKTYGDLEEFYVVGNLGEHMLGNVYLKYAREEDAERALKALNGRWYAGRQLTVEYSPVSDFSEARCRQYDEETCNRGAFCNFIHMRPLPSTIRRRMERLREKAKRRRRSRSRSRERYRERDRDRDRDRERDRDRDRERHDGGSSRSGRSASEERRARIAEWNAARDRKMAEAGDSAAPAPAPTDAYPPQH